jgi:proteasome assembly chaperone (PAC2) family protein
VDIVTVTQRPPALLRPVLLAAFQGWNDAGEAATGAIDVLARELAAQPFAEVDPEEFFDFQHSRPMIRLTEAGDRMVEWPPNRFSWAALPGGQRHVVLLSGTEPNLRWRTFAGGVVDLAAELGVETVITLGALQVDVPHTRPVPVTGVATDEGVAAALGLQRSRYEGPTGITGVLNQAASARGLRALSMWAGVPHYLSGATYLAGALALAERVTSLLEVDVPLGRLARDAVAQRDEIAELVADDDDLAEYVTELEERSDSDDGTEPEPGEVAPVSADELAAEVERYLRDRDR